MGHRYAAAALLAWAAGLPALGDTLLTTRIEGEAIPELNQPVRHEVTSLWIGKDALRHEQAVGTLLLDFAANRLFVVKPESRTYHVFGLPFDYAAYYPPESRKRIVEGRARLDLEVSVRATGQTREIVGYPAREYHVVLTNAMGMHQEIDYWTTTELGVDLTRYREYEATVAEFMPMGGAYMRRIHAAIEGFPLLKVTRTYIDPRVYVTTEQVATIESVTVAPGFYAVPSGYAQTPWRAEAGPSAGGRP